MEMVLLEAMWEFVNDPLTHGGNLDPISAQVKFFGLIFQKFWGFSGTWDMYY